KVILSLDCDFLGGEDDAHNHIQRFVKGRRPEAEGGMRLYVIESLFTLTGASADHRLRVPAEIVKQISGRIADEGGQIGGDTDLLKWLLEFSNDMGNNRDKFLVVAGQRQPLEVHLLACKINAAMGAIGNTLSLLPVTESPRADLKNLDGSAIDTLVILGGSPAYKKKWVPKQKPKTVVRLGFSEDETAEKSDWHYPLAHYLESWGDATTSDGTLVPVQPLIQPLHGGLTELEFLARIAGETQTNPHDIVRSTFTGSEEDWKRFLFDGYLKESGLKPIRFPEIPFLTTQVSEWLKMKAADKDNLEVIFY